MYRRWGGGGGGGEGKEGGKGSCNFPLDSISSP